MTKISKTRKIYFIRLCGRIIVFLVAVLFYILNKEEFEIIKGFNFFNKFSVLHILWGIWMLDMISQLMPVRAHISIGSQKQFKSFFKPIKEKINYNNLKKYIKTATVSAYKVMIIWVVLTVTICVLYFKGIIDFGIVLLISVFFYVCDLICVLIWCPFRLIMKNKCCTTCRIFNWDHLMMFSPLIAVFGFYTWSLVLLSFIIWIVWEVRVFACSERFWENSNMALKCLECTDKLCTQYCGKIR